MFGVDRLIFVAMTRKNLDGVVPPPPPTEIGLSRTISVQSFIELA